MIRLFLYIVLTSIVSMLNAQDGGIEVGEQAPEFSAVDQLGNTIELQNLLEDGPLVMVFYRGEWCPYCNEHLSQLDEAYEKIQMLDAELVAISPEKVQYTTEMSEKLSSGYSVLSDNDGAIMSAYKLDFELDKKTRTKYKIWGINLDKNNGDGNYNLPVPATFIVSKEGEVIYRHYDENYKERSDVEEILSVLNELKNKSED